MFSFPWYNTIEHLNNYSHSSSVLCDSISVDYTTIIQCHCHGSDDTMFFPLSIIAPPKAIAS